jgi:hypothetical protein
MSGVSLKSVDWTVMLARLKAKTSLNFNSLSLIRLQDVALLSTDKILEWASVLIVFKTSTSKNLLNGLVPYLESFVEYQLVNWSVSKLFHIPPKNTTIS